MEERNQTELQTALPAQRRPRRARSAVAACVWLYVVFLCGLWAVLLAADLWWLATLVMFSPRWLLPVPAAVLVVAAAYYRRWWSLGGLLLTLGLTLTPVTGFVVPWQRFQPATTSAGPRLRLFTCNMHYRKHDSPALDRFLADSQPDIVALQEWYESNQSVALLKGEWDVRRSSNLLLASRYPIRQVHGIGHDSNKAEGLVARYDLETPAGLVTLFNIHLASPRDGLEEAARAAWQSAAQLQAGSELRWLQSENLARQAAGVSSPLLLVGDFNTPPESAIFRRIWSSYADAFSAAGWGWGYTYLGHTARVRVDHILVSPGWRCDRCWVGPDVGSKHRPVLADLTWAANAASAPLATADPPR
jgi:vancomycin resistance protein VanJ